ncbi:MAG TPA: NAD-dependent epimerase/dehydratase family protein [Stellaceae bacterium]|nr:NAD-dependent epimerase/dehydratase family protein [Stellaceae bacterium]
MAILVTGAAGFIGFHTALALLRRGETVIGVDNLNPYYSVALKRARLAELQSAPGFAFREADIADRHAVEALLDAHPGIDRIVHLAAQAGVRYSLENPYAYVQANVMGQVVLLEAARCLKTLRHLVYASSSAVYGGNRKQPFAVTDPVDRPVSLYAATKRSAELIAQTYAGLYGMPLTGLRYFTVYGPWGRPDMAPWLFTEAILAGRPIDLFNRGEMARDFTYIDDIVAGTLAAIDRPPPSGEHRLYNLGNHRPERLADFVALLEQAIGRTAEKRLLPMQPGDVPETCADITESRRDLGYEPTTTLAEGLPRFVEWFRAYHGGLRSAYPPYTAP